MGISAFCIFILQQHWTPSHGAKSTKVVLDTHFPGYLGKDLWPASSPYLNPMDFRVWDFWRARSQAAPTTLWMLSRPHFRRREPKSTTTTSAAPAIP
uniref:Uncharacterized protein n=1 Tax=Caenorhabditis japonica TaxID=281687 RepID=A0A8R1ER88_CAEJA